MFARSQGSVNLVGSGRALKSPEGLFPAQGSAARRVISAAEAPGGSGKWGTVFERAGMY